jgi:hypothetical protein
MPPELRITDGEPMTEQPQKSPRRRPTIVANPAGDVVFAARVDACLEAGASDPPELEKGLRREYPAVVVRRREISNEPFEVWYVYREGRWIGRTSRA